MNTQKLLPKSVVIIEKAGKLLMKLQSKVREIEGPAGKDFLSDVDLKSNDFICAELRKLTPEIPIYSEEDKKKITETGKWWILDPLDGTINFFHQDVLWGVSLALIEAGKPRLAVIYLPAINQLIGVNQGEGVIIKGNIKFGVRGDNNLARAQVWTDWSKKSAEAALTALTALQKASRYPQIRLCSSFSFLAVATGRIAGYVEPPEVALEDMIAGSFIVEKAGGKATDLDGKPLTIFSSEVVVSNGLLHEQILEALKKRD